MVITVIASSVLATGPLATTTWNAPANTGCSSAVAPHGGQLPCAACASRVDAVVSAVLSGSSKNYALKAQPAAFSPKPPQHLSICSLVSQIWLASHLFVGPTYANGEGSIEQSPI
jgi:hypothetical protein